MKSRYAPPTSGRRRRIHMRVKAFGRIMELALCGDRVNPANLKVHTAHVKYVTCVACRRRKYGSSGGTVAPTFTHGVQQ